MPSLADILPMRCRASRLESDPVRAGRGRIVGAIVRPGRAVLLPALLMILLLATPGCAIVQVSVRNPVPGLETVAVAPFFNLSQERIVDGREFALAYYAELQKVPGFEVLPVGVAERAMQEHGIEMTGPEDAVRLAQLLNVDAVVVGAVTDYDPYVPRVGLKVAWYSPRQWLVLSNGPPPEPKRRKTTRFGRQASDVLRGQSPDTGPLSGPGRRSGLPAGLEAIEEGNWTPLDAGPASGAVPRSREHLADGSSRSGLLRLEDALRQAQSEASPAASSSPPERAAVAPTAPAGDSEVSGTPQEFLPPITVQPIPVPTGTGSSPQINGGGSPEAATAEPPSGSSPQTPPARIAQTPVPVPEPDRSPQPVLPPPSRMNVPSPGPLLPGQNQHPPLPSPAPVFPILPPAAGEPDGSADPRRMFEPSPRPTLIYDDQVVIAPEPFDPAEPLMAYVRMFDATDSSLVARVADYLELSGEQRSGDLEAYLRRSDFFRRFTTHVMIAEMLTLHGGEARRRLVLKPRRFR